jgi:hypothetical protein
MLNKNIFRIYNSLLFHMEYVFPLFLKHCLNFKKKSLFYLFLKKIIYIN